MAYDALAESVALIQSRRLVRSQQLSRRRRFVAMSVDVADDLAVTSFARRGAGCTWHNIHVLSRRHGHWVLLGGSGGSCTDERELLGDRPGVLMAWSETVHRPGRAPSSRSLAVLSSGGVRDSGGGPDRWPWSGRWISHAEVRATASVTALSVDGRLIAVPWHGRVVVVWKGGGPQVAALDGDGRPVDELSLAHLRFPGQGEGVTGRRGTRTRAGTAVLTNEEASP